MPSREVLMSHPVSTLRAEIAKANLSQKADKNLFKRAVSKMRKDELIAVMMAPAYKDRFHHIKMRPKKVAPRPLKIPRYPAVEAAKKAKSEAEAPKKRRARRAATPVLDVPESAPKKKRKPKKKPKISDEAIAKADAKAKGFDLVSFNPPLTRTKADGSVKEVKKRIRSKK